MHADIIVFGRHKRQKLEILDECVDRVRERFGYYSVRRGILLQDRGLNRI